MWFVLSLLTALLESLKDVSSKKSLRFKDPVTVAWYLNFISIFVLLPLLSSFKITASFWFALGVSGGINILTAFLYMKALKVSDISVTVPMINFTPAFLLIMSPLILGEIPSLPGIIGVIFITLGAYILTSDKLSSPLKSLMKESGPKIMLLIAFLWSITSNFDKIGVTSSSPILWAFSVHLLITLALTPFVIKKIRFEKELLLPGIFNGLRAITQMTALTMTYVAYVISIKRLSTVFGVIFGYLLFKEKSFKQRLLGSIVMFIGVLIIALS